MNEGGAMYEARNWYTEKIVQATLKNLERNGFTTFNIPSKEEALNKVLGMIPRDAKVGVGGSFTLREIGLVRALVERGNPVADHWNQGLTGEKLKEVKRSQLTADVFISSSNAITMDGKLINADGAGNRVASIIFGPRKVIIVAGVNKIVKDVDEGLKRIRNVVAPMNANRLGRKTPCGLTGICVEEQCESPERICNIITIVERRPSETDTIIVLIGEKLGY